jgi:hypothetical protein
VKQPAVKSSSEQSDKKRKLANISTNIEEYGVADSTFEFESCPSRQRLNEEDEGACWLVDPWSGARKQQQPYRFRAMREPVDEAQTNDMLFDIPSADCGVNISMEGLGQTALRPEKEEEQEENE